MFFNPRYAKTPGGAGAGGAQYPVPGPGTTPGDVLVWVGPNRNDVAWGDSVQFNAGLGAIFDGASDLLEINRYVDIPVYYDCDIVEWEMFSDVPCTCTVDVRVCSYAAAPPTAGNSIVGSGMPTMPGTNKNKSTSFTGWSSTHLNMGDVVRFILLTNNFASKLTFGMKVLKT